MSDDTEATRNASAAPSATEAEAREIRAGETDPADVEGWQQGGWMDEARRLWRTGDGVAVRQWWRTLPADQRQLVMTELVDFTTSLGTAMRETRQERQGKP